MICASSDWAMFLSNSTSSSYLMEFRLFEESDLKQYLAWVNQKEIWQVDNSGPYEFRTEESFRDQWNKIVGWNRSWMMTINGREIGYIGFVSDEDDELTDEFFIVIGEISEWGKGHGKKAMHWLFDTALEKGLTRLTGQVLGNNENALRFYDSLGFTVVSKGLPTFERDGQKFHTLVIEKRLDT